MIDDWPTIQNVELRRIVIPRCLRTGLILFSGPKSGLGASELASRIDPNGFKLPIALMLGLS